MINYQMPQIFAIFSRYILRFRLLGHIFFIRHVFYLCPLQAAANGRNKLKQEDVTTYIYCIFDFKRKERGARRGAQIRSEKLLPKEKAVFVASLEEIELCRRHLKR